MTAMGTDRGEGRDPCGIVHLLFSPGLHHVDTAWAGVTQIQRMLTHTWFPTVELVMVTPTARSRAMNKHVSSVG